LRLRASCRQGTRFLSCGSSELRRPPNVVGPYGLGPPSSPLARFELRSAVRSSDIWVERGGASTDTFYLPCSSTPLQSITAATSHRVLCRSCSRPVYARGRTPDEDRGRLRIRFRGVTRGWVPILRACSRASSRGGARRGDRIVRRLSLVLRSRPRPGADVFPPYGGGRTSERRRAASPGRQAGQGTRALGNGHRLRGSTTPRALRDVFAKSCRSGHSPQAASSGTGEPSQSRARKLPHARSPPRWEPERKTRSGNTMTPPMGFVSFRRGEHR